MLDAAVLVVALAFVALVVAVIPVLLQLRRTAHAAELALAAIEREIRPLAADLQALLKEHRTLAERAARELREIEALTSTVREVVGRVGRLTSVLGSVGTVGRALTLAQGLRRGATVFMNRLGRRRR